MKSNQTIGMLNLKIILLSYIFNLGAIIIGFAYYGLQLRKDPFDFISSHDYMNYIMLVVGLLLSLINLYFVLKLGKQKKLLQQEIKSNRH